MPSRIVTVMPFSTFIAYSATPASHDTVSRHSCDCRKLKTIMIRSRDDALHLHSAQIAAACGHSAAVPKRALPPFSGCGIVHCRKNRKLREDVAMRRWLCALTLLILIAPYWTAAAQDYPTRPIRVIA